MAQIPRPIRRQLYALRVSASIIGLVVCTLANGREITLEQRNAEAVTVARDSPLPSLPLAVLSSEAATARVVTWMPYLRTVGPVIDPTETRRADYFTWVSLQSEIQAKCKGFSQEDRKDLPVRIKQLLGLPPYFENGDAGGFAVLDVDVTPAQMLFRPCANSDPMQNACEAPPVMPTSRRSAHEEWMTDTAAASYNNNQFPWTRLGYTYDWATPEHAYGVSEYIVKKILPYGSLLGIR